MKRIDVKELLYKMLSVPIVIETGSNSNWTWRKWSDGTLECWGRYDFTLTHYSQAFGGYGYNSGTIYFPVRFVGTPYVFYSASIDNDWALTGSIPNGVLSNASCILYAVTTASGSQSTFWLIYAKGKWK